MEGSSGEMTGSKLAAIPVIIVAFRNAQDVNGCLSALGRTLSTPPLAIFICENGGTDAFDNLVAVLTGPERTCEPDGQPPMPTGPRLVRNVRLRLRTSDPSRTVSVQVGEACENLGYAGGVNAYLEPLLARTDWPGVWVLNPDTKPEPAALYELVQYAVQHNRDMVGSRQSSPHEPDIILGRGLAWRKWRGGARLVDWRVPATICPPPDEIDRQLDSPSGASMYVTRSCVGHIGLMDERYFLYFEDLDWGLRAKQQSLIGYAHRSVITHDVGTTIGSATSRRSSSALSVYLFFRNRLLFTRVYFPRWLAWTFLMEVIEILEYGRLRSFHNMIAAFRGAAAGLAGQTGRPDHFMRMHRTPVRTGKP
jgi:N-acetylglucosaminyl-diphospho-decaprenol L-rhamnosyltransferase